MKHQRTTSVVFESVQVFIAYKDSRTRPELLKTFIQKPKKGKYWASTEN